MKNAIEKTSDLIHKFTSNLFAEVESNAALKKDFENFNRCSPVRKALSSVYRGMQLSDYIISTAFKDYCSMPRKDSCVDRFFERTFSIPQYYGGIRSSRLCKGNTILDKILGWFGPYKSYRVIQNIQNEEIPSLFKRLFHFDKLINTTLEAKESLKRLREAVLEREPGWECKKMHIDDIRLVETESVEVRNLKKTIRCDFELSVILSGVVNKKQNNLRQCYSCSIDFIKQEDSWVASAFTFHEIF